MQTRKPAILYARFSTPSQEKGDSLERQLRLGRMFCEEHRLEVVEEICDLGRSAYKGDHLSVGNLGKLTQRIMSGEVPPDTTLVVEKMDRLSRQVPRIVQRWIEDACDRGLRIAIIDGARWIDSDYLGDGSNVMAMVDLLMHAHASNIFSKNLSDRVTSAWSRKERDGQSPH